MDRFEEFIVKKYPNRSPKVLLQKLQDIDGTWFYAVKEVQDQSEVWQLKQAEIDEKDKQIDAVIAELESLHDQKWAEWKERADMHSQGEANAYEHAMRILEKALRGEHE